MQLRLGELPQPIEIHLVMIGGAGTRRAATVILLGAVLGVGFGLRSAGPAQADPTMVAIRQGRLVAVARAAEQAVARLSAVMAKALDAGRRGAALTVSGTEPPGPQLEAAADALVAEAPTADAAQRALTVLAGTAAAISPDATIPTLSIRGPSLLLIGSDLRTSADAASAFVERRHAAEQIVQSLGEALAALNEDDPSTAITRLDATGAPRQLLVDWQERPALMSYWMSVTGELIEAARAIAEATIAGDSAAQKAAAERYAKATDAARGADNALAVTMAEEGSGASAGPLRSLAVAAGEAADVQAALLNLIQAAP